MVRRPSLFRTSSDGRLFAVSSQGTSVGVTFSEVKLREEFDEILFGYSSGIRHGSLIVIRHMRRDSEDKLVPCTCKQELSRSADPDCPYCQGEGYLWEEEWHWAYSMFTGTQGGLAARLSHLPPGMLRVDYKIFYVRFDTPIRYGDKVVEMKLDEEGSLIVPYKRESIYAPQTIYKYRSDNGRIEYIAIYCREDDAIREDA